VGPLAPIAALMVTTLTATLPATLAVSETAVQVLERAWPGLARSTALESPGHPPETGTLTITVAKLRNTAGHARLLLFAGPDGFPDQPRRAVKRVSLKIEDGAARVVLDGLAPGDYAVSVIHDENDNEALDVGWFGIPKEGFGFSNNPKIRRGPPSFEEASFTVSAGEAPRQSVRVVYF